MHQRRATTVKGHYRNGAWITPHRRSGTTVKDGVHAAQPAKIDPYRFITSLTAFDNCVVSKPPQVKKAHPYTACGNTTCPHCGAAVFFIRHNGGSVWLDSLGWPWPKHACFEVSEPSWMFYFRKYALPAEMQQSAIANENTVMGVLLRTKTQPEQKVLLAFDAGESCRLCLEVVVADKPSPLPGFTGVLNLRDNSITLSNFLRYPVLSLSASPAELELGDDWCIPVETIKPQE